MFTVPCEKSKTISFTSSTMKNIVAPAGRSRYLVKLICYIAFGSDACCLLRFIVIILY